MSSKIYIKFFSTRVGSTTTTDLATSYFLNRSGSDYNLHANNRFVGIPAQGDHDLGLVKAVVGVLASENTGVTGIRVTSHMISILHTAAVPTEFVQSMVTQALNDARVSYAINEME